MDVLEPPNNEAKKLALLVETPDTLPTSTPAVLAIAAVKLVMLLATMFREFTIDCE